jgi:hypothetical protein
VCEAEIQSFTAFIRGRLHVGQFLLNTHFAPYLLSLLVTPDIVDLSKDVEKNVQDAYPNQDAIAAAI